jgi:RNA polymerase sigma-70 factor (ECF subfamily)
VSGGAGSGAGAAGGGAGAAGGAPAAAAPSLDALHREHAGRLLALLVRELRDFDLAEESLQEAWEAALRQWRQEGRPDNPAGWLLTVARRRARDRLRRAGTERRALPLLIVEAGGAPTADRTGGAATGPGRTVAAGAAGAPPPGVSGLREPAEEEADAIPDERLRLIFSSCHPALAPEVRLALTLRFVAGLPTRAVARLLVVSEATMAARLTRAKRKIATSGIAYRVPEGDELAPRLASVLAVVYLLFTEGHLPSSGPRVVRAELCAEAIALARLLRELLPGEPEVTALLALTTLQHARRDARVDARGRLVRLPDQDRSRWRADEIAAGLALLDAAERETAAHARRAAAGGASTAAGTRTAAGPYALEARIAAEHDRAATAAATDWHAIAGLYARLEAVKPTPSVRLARAVAISEADGAAAALPLLNGIEEALPHSPQPHLARAELLRTLGRDDEALAAYDRALALAGNDAVRVHVTRRRAELSERG